MPIKGHSWCPKTQWIHRSKSSVTRSDIKVFMRSERRNQIIILVLKLLNDVEKGMHARIQVFQFSIAMQRTSGKVMRIMLTYSDKNNHTESELLGLTFLDRKAIKREGLWNKRRHTRRTKISRKCTENEWRVIKSGFLYFRRKEHQNTYIHTHSLSLSLQ